MGSFSKIERRIGYVISELNEILEEVSDLKGIVKDSKREKVDDIQRQLNKLQERLDNENAVHVDMKEKDWQYSEEEKKK